MEKIINRILTFLFISFLLMVISTYELHANRDKETPLRLLFQELLFNIPTDKFFILDFDAIKAKSRLITKMNYKEVLNMYGLKTAATSEELQTHFNDVDSFIKLQDNDFLIFRHDSSLLHISNGKEIFIRKMKGIVTEAGRINEDWGWFCLRRNEKYIGLLFFINLNNFKIIKSGIKVHCKLITILPALDN